MPKKSLPLVLILVLAAGGLFYLKSRSGKTISLNPATQSPAQTLTEAQKFASLISSGKPYSCTLTKDNVTVIYQGKGDKMFISTTSPEGTNYMIQNQEYLYSWSNQSAQGSKMRLPTQEETEQATQALPSPSNLPSFTSTTDYQSYQDQGYTIQCNEQNLSDSVFVPPDNITFIDPSAMMQGTNGEVDLSKLQEMARQYASPTP